MKSAREELFFSALRALASPPSSASQALSVSRLAVYDVPECGLPSCVRSKPVALASAIDRSRVEAVGLVRFAGQIYIALARRWIDGVRDDVSELVGLLTEGSVGVPDVERQLEG